MKDIIRKILTIVGFSIVLSAGAESLVLLHTNDTHSNIDTDENGVGGVLPRKAIIDSVRRAEKNVILIDAGDAVQGSLYFKYFKGDVEYPLFNMMDYDIRILGNHEFDNGIEELARYWATVKGDRLSANYDFSDTPAKGLFKPYVIKKIGKRKIGFIGINIDPASLISNYNITGMKYTDAITEANKWAGYLRNREKCDLVVAVTHIGYTSDNNKGNDVELARASKDIDIIIGGHSHTFVNPDTPDKTPYWISNAEGKPVLVAQTGKYGKNIGYIKIDLNDISGHNFDYEYIPVTDRFSPKEYDSEIEAFLKPYREKVDSINNIFVGYSYDELPNGKRTGALANWSADAGRDIMHHITDSLRACGINVPTPDFALMNVGGIRQPMPEGMVSEGRVLVMFPFDNKLRLIRMKGSDIIETMAIVAEKGGEAISSELRVITDNGNKMERVLLHGRELDPEKYYTVATIDYIAEGNDDMIPMSRNELLWEDHRSLGLRMLGYVRALGKAGLGIDPDGMPRFTENFRFDIDDD